MARLRATVQTSVRGVRRRINLGCCSFLFGVGRTLLSAALALAFDFALDFALTPASASGSDSDRWRTRMPAVRDYPFTLTREKDNTARPVVGLPMESAGRNVVKVVKISMFFFTCGSNGSSSLESERMR